MLCPGCNKFPAFSTDNEPEVDLNEFDEVTLVKEDGKDNHDKAEGTITGTCRIVLTSECCGEECKDTTFDIEINDVELTKAKDCTCGDKWIEGLMVEGSGETTDRSETSKPKTYKRGPKKGQTVNVPIPYRYQRRYYGADVTVTVSCACEKQVGEATWSDEVQAGAMEELC